MLKLLTLALLIFLPIQSQAQVLSQSFEQSRSLHSTVEAVQKILAPLYAGQVENPDKIMIIVQEPTTLTLWIRQEGLGATVTWPYTVTYDGIPQLCRSHETGKETNTFDCHLEAENAATTGNISKKPTEQEVPIKQLREKEDEVTT